MSIESKINELINAMLKDGTNFGGFKIKSEGIGSNLILNHSVIQRINFHLAEKLNYKSYEGVCDLTSRVELIAKHAVNAITDENCSEENIKKFINDMDKAYSDIKGLINKFYESNKKHSSECNACKS